MKVGDYLNFNSIDELIKYVKVQIDDTLDKEVADGVMDEIIMSVDSTVYGAGDPVMYDRRGLSPTSQGLGGRTQMHHTVDDGVLEVIDDAQPSNPWDTDLSLAENIEYGYGDASKREWWNQPRPFIEDARDNMENDKYHVEKMKEGLEKRGFTIL